MPRPTATVSVGSKAAKAAPTASPSALPSMATALAFAAGLAGAALSGGLACARSDACATAVSPFLLWRAGSTPYTAPATPASRFGSAESAPIPGSPEAVALSAKAAAEAAKPAPPTDGPIPGMWVDGGANAPRDADTPAWPARIRVERARFFPRKAGALEMAIKVRRIERARRARRNKKKKCQGFLSERGWEHVSSRVVRAPRAFRFRRAFGATACKRMRTVRLIERERGGGGTARHGAHAAPLSVSPTPPLSLFFFFFFFFFF